MKYILILLFTACASEPKQDYPDKAIREIDSVMNLLKITKAKYDSAVAEPCDTVYIKKIIYKSVDNLYIGPR